MITWIVCTAWLACAADENTSGLVEHAGLPLRVHVFEDYETDIERRWWLRGEPQTEDVPPSLSESVPNRQACRATETKDFDDLMGDPAADYKAVIFNPVPGPPMGANTRLGFRYRLSGSDTLRVQIYSLTNGYHRRLVLTGLPQDEWQSATVDMTQLRRPDGSGGPLSADERIDDIQFYVSPDADLAIDDIVLYEAAPAEDTRPFPRRTIFAGWFDTGEQGKEWPGDFEIVPHEPPRTWDVARSVTDDENSRAWIRIGLRGERTLSAETRLRFFYRLSRSSDLRIELGRHGEPSRLAAVISEPGVGQWLETEYAFRPDEDDRRIDEIRFIVDAAAELLVDDVLLYEPGADDL